MTEQELESKFLEISNARSHFLAQNKPAQANRKHDELHDVVKSQIRMLPDKGEALLKRLCRDIDFETRIEAAAYLLVLDDAFARGVLLEIAKAEHVLTSFTAEQTLKEWDKGNLRDYLG